MKRILALMLSLVLLAALFPAKLVAKADTVTKKGFYYEIYNSQYAI